MHNQNIRSALEVKELLRYKVTVGVEKWVLSYAIYNTQSVRKQIRQKTADKYNNFPCSSVLWNGDKLYDYANIIRIKNSIKTN